MTTSLVRLAAAAASVAPAFCAPVLLGGEKGVIVPSNLNADGRFGRALAVDGSSAVFGAPGDDVNGARSGSAFVYDLATDRWVSRLVPADGVENAFFGASVGISGGTVIVGAVNDDDNGFLSGSAYLFDAATGQELAKLLDPDGSLADYYGQAVAISGERALVGAPLDDDLGGNSGTVFVYDVATAQQLLELHPSDAAVNQRFGNAVAIDGSLVLVGAVWDEAAGERAGAAYLFDATTGQELFKLTPADAHADHLFGWSVALDGAIAVVGAIWDADNGESSGAAYLFDTSTGLEIAKLRPIDGDPGDHFGESVAVASGTVLVGAYADDERGKDSGSAYLFDAAGQPIAKLIATGSETWSAVGSAVGLSGATAVVGAYRDQATGTAFLFDVAPEVSVGTNVCGPAVPNSSGASGVMNAYGSLVVADNCLRLEAVDLARHQYAMFLNGQVQGFSTPPGSQGNLCLAGSIGRYNKQIAHTGLDGAASVSLDLPNTPHGGGTVAIQPGETWYFQAWFRDQNPTATSNFSDAIGITFL